MIQILEISILAAFIFFVQQKIYEKLWSKNLTASISFKNEAIFEGEKGSIIEVIENRKRLPLSMLKVRFQTSRNLVFDSGKGSKTSDKYYRNDVFHISGGEKITRTVPFVGGRRGFYHINDMELIASDLFMTTEMGKTLCFNESIYVYPTPFNSDEFSTILKNLNGDVITRRHMIEDPFEYRGIREYQPYDDMKSINWKATAKTGDLKVNQKNYTSLPSIRIFFNVEDKGVLKKTDAVEATYQIVAGISKFFLNQDVRVACYGNGVDESTDEPVSIHYSTGKGHLDMIYKNLARIDNDKKTADFNKYFKDILLSPTDNAITIVVSPNHYDPFVNLLKEFKDEGGKFTWIYPVWESTDPKLPEEFTEEISILHIRK